MLLIIITVVAIIAIVYIAPGHTAKAAKTIAPYAVPTMKVGLDIVAISAYKATEAKYIIKESDQVQLNEAKAMDTRKTQREIEAILQDAMGLSDIRKDSKKDALKAKAAYKASVAS